MKSSKSSLFSRTRQDFFVCVLLQVDPHIDIAKSFGPGKRAIDIGKHQSLVLFEDVCDRCFDSFLCVHCLRNPLDENAGKYLQGSKVFQLLQQIEMVCTKMNPLGISTGDCYEAE